MKPILDKALSHLVGLGKEKGYFVERSNDGRGTDNNLAARQAACLTDIFLVDIVELARQTDTEHSATIILTGTSPVCVTNYERNLLCLSFIVV